MLLSSCHRRSWIPFSPSFDIQPSTTILAKWSSFVKDNKNDFLILVEVCGNVSITLQNNQRAIENVLTAANEQASSGQKGISRKRDAERNQVVTDQMRLILTRLSRDLKSARALRSGEQTSRHAGRL